MIYTVGGIKGGSGKTTVATNLVVWLAQQGADVLLVDTDYQHTATLFTACREVTLKGDTGFTSLRLAGDAVIREVSKLRDKFQHIVIDVGGHDHKSQRGALLMSDVYLLPFKPKSPDVWTAELVRDLLEETRAVRPAPLAAYSFLCMAGARGPDNREAGGLLATIEGITFLPDAFLVNRNAYSDAISKGLSVLELKPPDLKAANEVNTLFSLITKNNNHGSSKKSGGKLSRHKEVSK